MITCAYEPTPAFQPGESVWLSCPLPWNTHTHHRTNANLIQLQIILLQTFTLTFPGMRTGWLRDPYTSHGVKTDAENTRCVQRCLFHSTPVFFSYIVESDPKIMKHHRSHTHPLPSTIWLNESVWRVFSVDSRSLVCVSPGCVCVWNDDWRQQVWSGLSVCLSEPVFCSFHGTMMLFPDTYKWINPFCAMLDKNVYYRI